MPAAVVDTNVWISAVLEGKTAAKIVELLTDKTFQLIISDKLFEELIFTVRRAKLNTALNDFDREVFISLIKANARFIKPSLKLNICRDSEDDKLLECAVEVKADFVVTGDSDLLTLNPFRGIEIIKPAEFLKRLNNK